MALTSYLVGAKNAIAGSSATVTVPVGSSDTLGNAGSATNNGDGIVVEIGWSGTATIVSVTDTQGNSYPLVQATTGAQTASQYCCPNGVALSTSDNIVVVFSTGAGARNVIVHAATGSPGGWTVDSGSKAIGLGTSTAPTVTSGALAQAIEIVFALFQNTSGGGSPASITGATRISQEHVGSTSWTTIADNVSSATTAETISATITSTSWGVLVFALIPQNTKNISEAGGGTETFHVAAVADLSRVRATPITASALVDISRITGFTGRVSGGLVDVAEVRANTVLTTSTTDTGFQIINGTTWMPVRMLICDGTNWV